MSIEDTLGHWNDWLCRLPQVEDVAITEVDGDPAILVFIQPDAPSERQLVGIPQSIDGFRVLVALRPRVGLKSSVAAGAAAADQTRNKGRS